MATISCVVGFCSTGCTGLLKRTLLLGLAGLLLAGCTTTYTDFENPRKTEEVTDDRPLVAFNTLMEETFPLARDALENGSDQFSPKAFALSRQGGVRPVTILGGRAQSEDARIALLFDSLEIMTRGDDIIAFVVYATGSGYLVNTPAQNQVLIAHLEHQSGRAILRRLSYTREGGKLRWGAEDVDRIEGLVFTTQQPAP